MLELGRRAFFMRAGPYDFSCASCHSEPGRRIRLQDLPDLTKNPGDGVGIAAWPAYRVSSGELWSMQPRLNDCCRQQRFAFPGCASDVTLAEARTKAIEAENLKTVKMPSDGKFIGDWQAGERICRPGGRINSPGFERGRVEQCHTELNPGLLPEDVTAIAAVRSA
jgi:hypothetical protein